MINNLTLNMDAYLPLRDVVFNTLRDAILKGDLQPGERLMELSLASQLGVSRTPIREAIRMLEQEGLAVTIARKGAEVARMTLKEMEDVLEVREALDELAARIACSKITAEQIHSLKENSRRFAESTTNGNLQELASADEAFHDIIYAATDNQKLINLLENLRHQIYRYRIEYLKNSSIYPALIEEHNTIIEALEAHDQDAVLCAMKKHIVNQADAVKQVIQQQDALRVPLPH